MLSITAASLAYSVGKRIPGPAALTPSRKRRHSRPPGFRRSQASGADVLHSVLHRLGGMLRYPQRVALCGALLTLTVAGCSSNEQKSSTPPTTSTSELPPLPAEPARPGAVGVSPGGVTTRVDVPADATESQYGQACHAAKVWMDSKQTDPKTLVEPYLKMVQAPEFRGPGNFNTPWANLTPAQQAGAIMAVTGAANGECE
jgi:hypothetical protein